MSDKPGSIQLIGGELCDEFQRLLPLKPRQTGRRQPPSAEEIKATSAAALKDFYAAARTLRASHRLAFIGRARVAFDLQQRLLAAGYPPPLVKQVLFALLTSAFVGDQR